MIQFLNVFMDDQKESPMDMLKILRLKNFCFQVHSLETIVKDDPQALQYISQYVRGHKGPPLDYDQNVFWRDLDSHPVVFYDANRNKRGSDTQQSGTSSIAPDDASFLKHRKALRKGFPRHHTAVNALSYRPEAKHDNLKPRTVLKEHKAGISVCFIYRDKGECRFGNKCHFTHDSAQVSRAKEERASMNVFGVNLPTDESDIALMAANRGIPADTNHDLDTSSNTLIDTFDDDFDDNHDEDRDSEDHVRRDGGKRAPNINMFTALKRFRSVYLP